MTEIERLKSRLTKELRLRVSSSLLKTSSGGIKYFIIDQYLETNNK